MQLSRFVIHVIADTDRRNFSSVLLQVCHL